MVLKIRSCRFTEVSETSISLTNKFETNNHASRLDKDEEEEEEGKEEEEVVE